MFYSNDRHTEKVLREGFNKRLTNQSKTMNESLINQHKEFISQCKTIGEVNEREFRIWRCYEGKIPEELKEAIEKRKSEINGSNHSTVHKG